MFSTCGWGSAEVKLYKRYINLLIIVFTLFQISFGNHGVKGFLKCPNMNNTMSTTSRGKWILANSQHVIKCLWFYIVLSFFEKAFRQQLIKHVAGETQDLAEYLRQAGGSNLTYHPYQTAAILLKHFSET